MTALELQAQVPGAVTVSWSGRYVLFRVDPSYHAGAISSSSGRKIRSAAQLALQMRVPLVGVLSSSGADVHEGVGALHAWGSIARALVDCSGIVPTALAVTGPIVSGPALLLGLVDIVAMTPSAFAYVCGPGAVREWTGRSLSPEQLGGAAIHGRLTGVATFVDEDPLERIEGVLAYLPANNDEEPPIWDSDDRDTQPTPELRDLLPATPNGSYDVRRLIDAISDEFLELRARWAPNLVTGFAVIGGRPVGIVANQPQSVAGTLDIEASQKGARFVALCDAFNLPIVTLVDTPGFFPGKDLEWRGMIRHGAQLAFAYAAATVPRICLITRKSYGGAYIVMDCKAMGNDLCLAWPSAEVAVMGAKGAVAILYRREDEAIRVQREDEYATELLTPWVAAQRGYIDAVIDPADTRDAIARALATLETKRDRVAPRAHANTPL
jgi:acetyl-CoA carboxylase carboxyltransferase component